MCVLEQLQVVAFTHQFLPLDFIGKLHLEDAVRNERLHQIKTRLDLKEMVYVSTCNRVEFIACATKPLDVLQIRELLELFQLSTNEINLGIEAAARFTGDHAVEHLFKVASSLDSMVIGEREIITQLRNAFEEARNTQLSGDTLRLVGRKLIETAKQVYTETHIAKKPVSVVSLAYHNFKQQQISHNTPILLIGAGQTNNNLAKFLLKAGYLNVVIANRSIEKAELIANQHPTWQAVELSKLVHLKTRFEAIFTCTGSQQPILDSKLVAQIATSSVVVYDLALPADCASELIQNLANRYTGMNELKSQADTNLSARALEVKRCEQIIQNRVDDFRSVYKQRQLEIAMRSIPSTIKQIKETAVNEIFAKDLAGLDAESKAVLENVIAYMEKKYISVPMKMAREVILSSVKSTS